MPIEHIIDHPHRLVIARIRGKLTGEDLFEYQRTVWSAPEIAGYDELVDMTETSEIPDANLGGMQRLASLSASMDAPALRSKFVVIAPGDLSFGLGRMYQAFREMQEAGTREVRIFRTEAEALAFLEIAGPLPEW
jgi:hypothetical protein